MKEMYVILGWIGWIWLAVVLVMVSVGLWVQRGRRRRDEDVAARKQVVASDEK